MNSPVKVEFSAWIQELERKLSAAAQVGMAEALSLHGYNEATKESLHLPDYARNLPRPLALRAGLDILESKGMTIVAETGSARICEGSHCRTYNTVLALSAQSVYLSAYRPLYGNGGIADAVQETPHPDLVRAFVDRANLASALAPEEVANATKTLQERLNLSNS